MTISYFLGANSKDGFHSLYNGFCSQYGDYLSVIKGGPGTGKSGFMRKIGRAAEMRGLDVEYIICSGDPESLDGVYIPALRRGWVDGTAPHTIDPVRFGVSGDYVNFGAYLHTRPDSAECMEINALFDAYKAEYARAYAYLASTAALRRAYMPPLFTGDARALIERRMHNILRRCSSRPCAKLPEGAYTGERYFHALSCQGEIWLSHEAEKLCTLIYQLDDGFGGADIALHILLNEAEKLGARAIAAPCALDSARLDALFIPEWDVGFVSAGYDIEKARHIRLDAAIDAAAVQPYRAQLREGRQLENQLKARALQQLGEAKRLHDELEAHYKKHMDFTALTAYTEGYIAQLF